MRIGVDASCWSNRRGYGRFTRALLGAALAVDQKNSYVFFIDHDPAEFPLPFAVEVVRVRSTVPAVVAAAADGRRSLRDVWEMSRAISRQSLDLVFFPSVYTYVPVWGRAQRLVTIHDAIPELYPELVFPTKRSRFFWRAKTKLGCAQARFVLTVSDYAARCISEQYKLSPSRIRIVSESGDPAFRPLKGSIGPALLSALGLPDRARFIVYVGGFSPHKNLALLVDVFRELQARPEFNDLRLVLAGDYEGDVFYSCYQQLLDQVRRAGLSERVVFSGHLGDSDLVVLLNSAAALALPSFSEGFGLPAVEAAACGTPALVTTESPLAGLLGEGVIAIKPHDRPGWVTALARILGNPALRERMSRAALEAAQRLSWQNSAKQLLAIFDEAASSR
jgi:glycosyltransferase involved in cell wall biosynthesis